MTDTNNTQPTGAIQDDGLNGAKALEATIQPQQETPENVKPTVAQLNAKIAEADDVKQPTAKQLEKAKKAEERHWNSMITRKQAKEMVEEAINETRQHMQLLYIQVQSMFELMTDKGHTTVEEMEEYSKRVIEKVFGQPPVEQPDPATPEQPVSEEVQENDGNRNTDSSNK